MIQHFSFQTEGDEIVDEDMLEMAPLKNRFSFFENFKDKEEERQKQKKGRASPTRDVSYIMQFCEISRLR
jgi:hypothetical protein